VRDILFSVGGKSIILLEGLWAAPARPSDRNNVKVKTLWHFEAEAHLNST
jgi:hypothetical protein